MKLLKLCLLALVLILSISACSEKNEGFVTVRDGQFILNDEPLYFMGTNFWYGAVLGSSAKGGDRDRLIRELDFMKESGITNLRVLVGAEGPENSEYRVQPTLLKEPGVYNENLLEGLDFLLAEMGKRDMKAVLFLTNSWDWSGGIGQYLEWNGYGESPVIMAPDFDWPKYQEYMGQFYHCQSCVEQYHQHIEYIIGRENSVTGIDYVNDPTIMTWQVGNEPRPFGENNVPAFKAVMKSTVALIKKLAPNQLASIGSEGMMGSQNSYEVFEEVHADSNVDYLTFHVWPKNWRYIDWDDVPGTIDAAIEKTAEYMDKHIDIARKLKKPLVAEEFGVPRDNHGYSPDEPVTSRDKYYEFIFSRVLEHSHNNDVLAGSNFWSYGGFGRPSQVWFKEGDDYLGDPPCEEQGLNSVFSTDPTFVLIKKYANDLNHD
jgi:mannan endo-1,4-beta-mannosidase